MRKSIGFIVKRLHETDELGKNIVSTANSLVDSGIEAMAFFDTYGITAEMPKFARFSQSEVWGFTGPVISVDIETTLKLLNSPGPTKKLFYVSKFEWIDMDNPSWSYLSNIYQNDNIELLAQTEEDYNILSNVWKKPLCVCGNLDYKIIKDLI